MTNHEPKHPPGDVAGLDGLVERLQQDTNETDTWGRKKNWTEQRSERRKAATAIQSLTAQLAEAREENERLRNTIKTFNDVAVRKGKSMISSIARAKEASHDAD